MTEFKVGDRVKWDGLEFTIRAIDGDVAWLNHESGDYNSVDISDLLLIPNTRGGEGRMKCPNRQYDQHIVGSIECCSVCNYYNGTEKTEAELRPALQQAEAERDEAREGWEYARLTSEQWKAHANNLGDLLAKREEEIERLSATPVAPSVGELEHVLKVEMGEFTRYHLTCNLDDSAACHQCCATHLEGGCGDPDVGYECVQRVYEHGCIVAEWVNDGGIEGTEFEHTVEIPVEYHWDGAHDYPILSVLQRILSGAAEECE